MQYLSLRPRQLDNQDLFVFCNGVSQQRGRLVDTA